MTNKLTFEQFIQNIDRVVGASGEMLTYTDPAFHEGYNVALLSVRDVIVELQANYSPRIEMTPPQYKEFKNAKEKYSIINALNYVGLDEDSVISAWLHPETIINSETGKPFVEE